MAVERPAADVQGHVMRRARLHVLKGGAQAGTLGDPGA